MRPLLTDAILLFFMGFVFMAYELVGVRFLTPFFGSGIEVWSVLIGYVLLSTAGGYYWGGLLADRKSASLAISRSLFVSFILLTVNWYFGRIFLTFVDAQSWSYYIKLFFSAGLLFALPYFSASTITPIVVKLHVSTHRESGKILGILNAISVIGNVSGVLATGLYLLPIMGASNLMGAIVFVVGACFIFYSRVLPISQQFIFYFLLGVVMLVGLNMPKNLNVNGETLLFEKDSVYGNIQVFAVYWAGEQLRVLKTSKTGYQGIVNADFHKDSIDYYPPGRDLFSLSKLHSSAHSWAIIGGGSYILPRYLLSQDVSLVDVVEIDPAMTKIAQDFFWFDQNDLRMRVHHVDGRMFARSASQNTYDILALDVYVGMNIPYHLITKEAFLTYKAILKDDGFLLINNVDCSVGCEPILAPELFHTLEGIFSSVVWYVREDRLESLRESNTYFVATNKKLDFPLTIQSGDHVLRRLDRDLSTEYGTILTDDRFPLTIQAH